MQLVKLSDNLRPLTIAAGLLTEGSTLAYSDLDDFSGIIAQTSNSTTTEYIKTVDKRESIYSNQKFVFQFHLNKWESKMKFLSSTNAIVENDDFRAIVNMGHIAVPFILEEIDRKPSTLVWALNFIFGRKITNRSGATIADACKLWVKELKR